MLGVRCQGMKPRVVALIVSVLVAFAAPAVAQELTPTPSPTATPRPSNGLPTNIPPGVTQVLTNILQKVSGDAGAGFGINPNHIRGGVVFFRRFDMQVQMPLNTYKDVHLHQGTVINPRGESIQAGQTVDVQGSVNSDGSINADVITIVH